MTVVTNSSKVCSMADGISVTVWTKSSNVSSMVVRRVRVLLAVLEMLWTLGRRDGDWASVGTQAVRKLSNTLIDGIYELDFFVVLWSLYS